MMWKPGRKKDQPTVNMLDLTPVRLLECETAADGRVTLRKPRFKNRLLLRLLPRLSRKLDTVSLDQFGSHVWSRIDGRATVRDIGLSLREAYGEDVEPVYQRLGLFCRQLAVNRFIEFTGWPAEDARPVE